ncbi:hypothetical protein IW256_002250 [Actinomadura viridis]|uniref:Uncharacterized protein n=1 Tax=Actinomadura viridis TaxID=58110 RepID=A0A931DH49_9ACTN|nr:hypothetical protein [Actinomadura viridis]
MTERSEGMSACLCRGVWGVGPPQGGRMTERSEGMSACLCRGVWGAAPHGEDA